MEFFKTDVLGKEFEQFQKEVLTGVFKLWFVSKNCL